jgi:hypothetical protein
MRTLVLTVTAFVMLAVALTAANSHTTDSVNLADSSGIEATPPSPVVVHGVTVTYSSDRECPEGLECSPCWMPSPSKVEDPDSGRVSHLPMLDCRPDVYTSSEGESLEEAVATIADIVEYDVSPDQVCVDEEWANSPSLPMPEGTKVFLC